MMENKISDKWFKIYAFFIGLLVCNNVVYIFKVGNTHINISLVYAVILFGTILIKNRMLIRDAITEINSYAKIFFIICVISGISCIVVFGVELDCFKIYLNGIISLILISILYIDILCLKKYKNIILKGLLVGFLLNIFISLLQYIIFLNGKTLTLYDYFPQYAFQISTQWNEAKNFIRNGAFYIFEYRAQGFFLETSYYFAFIGGIAIVLFTQCDSSILKKFISLILLYLIIISKSGNMIIIFLSFAIYLCFRIIKSNDKTKIKFIKSKVSRTLIIFGLFTMFFLVNFSNINEKLRFDNLIAKFVQSVKTTNLTDEDNKNRLTSMLKTINLIPEYPIGVGYNLSTKILEKEDAEKELQENTTFNTILKIALETSVLGMYIYIVYIYNISIRLIFVSKDNYQLSLGVR